MARRALRHAGSAGRQGGRAAPRCGTHVVNLAAWLIAAPACGCRGSSITFVRPVQPLPPPSSGTPAAGAPPSAGLRGRLRSTSPPRCATASRYLQAACARATMNGASLALTPPSTEAAFWAQYARSDAASALPLILYYCRARQLCHMGGCEVRRGPRAVTQAHASNSYRLPGSSSVRPAPPDPRKLGCRRWRGPPPKSPKPCYHRPTRRRPTGAVALPRPALRVPIRGCAQGVASVPAAVGARTACALAQAPAVGGARAADTGDGAPRGPQVRLGRGSRVAAGIARGASALTRQPALFARQGLLDLPSPSLPTCRVRSHTAAAAPTQILLWGRHPRCTPCACCC